jgi:hypothetical protein
MTITKSKQRISDFQRYVNDHASDIRAISQSSWDKLDFSASEPKIVYEFLQRNGVGTDYLNKHLAPRLSIDGRVVKFASVFLHQKPMVRGWKDASGANLQPRCELGDLQMVFLCLASNKTTLQCRSIIFQAKRKPAGGLYVIDHPEQRGLYDQCPGFVYDTVLAGQSRHLPTGQLRDRALQYLFMGGQPVQSRTIPSNQDQGAFLDFGEMFVRLLNDSTGLDFSDESTTTDGWTQIVWDQLHQIAPTKTKGESRSNGLIELLKEFNDFEDKQHYFKNVRHGDGQNLEPEGFGTLLVITSDSQIEGLPLPAERPIDPYSPFLDHDIKVGPPIRLRQKGQTGGSMLEA